MSTVVAVIAALIALYIGLMQWRTAHYRLSFDLYEKRFAVYEATKNFLTTILNQKQVTWEDYTALYNGIRGAEFLFSEQTRSYLEDIRDVAWRAQTIRTELVRQTLPNLDEDKKILKFANERYEKLSGEEQDILTSLSEQHETLEKMFKPYLDLSKAGLKSYWPW